MTLRETALSAFQDALREQEAEKERLERERYESDREALKNKIRQNLGFEPTTEDPIRFHRAYFFNQIRPVAEIDRMFFVLHDGRLTYVARTAAETKGLPNFENTGTINGIQDLGRVLSAEISKRSEVQR
jgi:hypothetical protein